MTVGGLKCSLVIPFLPVEIMYGDLRNTVEDFDPEDKNVGDVNKSEMTHVVILNMKKNTMIQMRYVCCVLLVAALGSMSFRAKAYTERNML